MFADARLAQRSSLVLLYSTQLNTAETQHSVFFSKHITWAMQGQIQLIPQKDGSTQWMTEEELSVFWNCSASPGWSHGQVGGYCSSTRCAKFIPLIISSMTYSHYHFPVSHCQKNSASDVYSDAILYQAVVFLKYFIGYEVQSVKVRARKVLLGLEMSEIWTIPLTLNTESRFPPCDASVLHDGKSVMAGDILPPPPQPQPTQPVQ